MSAPPPGTRTRRVHIIGCYRSGTTLLMEMMWQCFSFSGRAAHEASLFDLPGGHETLYLSKKPPDTARIERAFLGDEQTFLVAMLRDPRSVLASRHPSRPGVYFRGFRHWRDCATAIRRLSEHRRCLVVRFEQLLCEPDAVQRTIEQRFGFLQRRARFSEYPAGVQAGDEARKSLGGARRLDRTRIDGWKEYLPRIKSQLAAHPELASALIDWGYEPDTAWTSMLDGITPAGSGYKDKAPHLFKRLETAMRYRRRTRAYLRRRRLAR